MCHQKSAAELLALMASGVTAEQKAADIAELAKYRSPYSPEKEARGQAALKKYGGVLDHAEELLEQRLVAPANCEPLPGDDSTPELIKKVARQIG